MDSLSLAPIVIFVYNRPWHTEKMLESLKNNKLSNLSEIYVFADGQKENVNANDLQKINETRALLKKIDWCKKITIIEQDANKGLATSIINGVTEVINKHGKAIVLEDDLLLSSQFLEFMNEGLAVYENAPNVYSINGFMFPINFNQKKVVLLPYIFTWGWATWKSKWNAFDSEMEHKETVLANNFLSERFNLGDYKYTNMLNFENNSWGIKWYYSVFLRNGLSVFPTHSLVKNIGLDGSGTNSGIENEMDLDINMRMVVNLYEKMDLLFFDKFILYFKKKDKGRFFGRKK